jgi:hypothetical protein
MLASLDILMPQKKAIMFMSIGLRWKSALGVFSTRMKWYIMRMKEREITELEI